MKIAIIGTGAMGSLFGAILSSVSDVCLIGHFKEHIQAIHERGLVIEKPDQSFKTFHFPASIDPSSLNTKFDLAIIFTKSYQTEAAAQTAKPLLAEKGVALTLQNGLGNADVMADILGKSRVIAGVTSHGCTLMEPGKIRHAGDGPTYIGGSPENTKILHQIASLFSSAGIETNIADDINRLIWGKLLINVGINALTRARPVAALPRTVLRHRGAAGRPVAQRDRPLSTATGSPTPGSRRRPTGCTRSARSRDSPPAASWAPSPRSPRCSGPTSTWRCTRPRWTCAAPTPSSPTPGPTATCSRWAARSTPAPTRFSATSSPSGCSGLPRRSCLAPERSQMTSDSPPTRTTSPSRWASSCARPTRARRAWADGDHDPGIALW